MKWIAGVMAAAALLLAPAAAAAASGGNKIVELPKGTTHAGTFYAAGRTVTVDGDVNGDVICAGQTVTVNGAVNGDVICAAQDITINGPVSGSVRVAAQTVTLNGTVGRNVTALGQLVLVGTGGNVAGDLAAAGQSVVLSGPVGQNVYVASQALGIGATIGGNVEARLGQLSMVSGASVGGNFNYVSADMLPVDSSKVHGTVTHSVPPQRETRHVSGGALVGMWFAGLVYWILAALGGALLAVWLLPRFVRGVTNQMIRKPWASIGWGFVAVLAGPLVLLLVALTVIGLPVVFVVGLLWLAALLVSGGLVGVAGGRLMLQHKTADARSLAMAALVGVPLAVLIIWLPVLGIAAALVASWWATGGMLLALNRARSLD